MMRDRRLGIALLLSMITACADSVTTSPSPGPATTSPVSPDSPQGSATTNPAAPGLQRLAGHLTPEIANAPRVGRVEPSKAMTLTIGLPLRNPADLEAAVGQVSDPQSPSYRHYLTPDEFADRYGATGAEYQNVIAWATSKNLTVSTHANRLVLQVSGRAADVEAALHVHLNYGLRPDGSQFHAPDAEPSLELAVPVEHISNLDNYVLPRHASGSGPGGSRQGSDFRNAYASCTSMTGAGQTIGIFMSDGFAPGDITNYFASVSLVPPRGVQTEPPGTGTTPGLEGTLDIEMVLSMAPGAQVVAFTGDTETILSNMADRPDIKQFSSSWFPHPISSTAKNLLAQLAVHGQSFFQASGDDGASPPGYLSADNDFRQQPTVTTVGGTALNMNEVGSSYNTESAWSLSQGMILSYRNGGGIAIPSYQVGLANSANQASSIYRNVPDVSAEAADVNIYFQNGTIRVFGTSAAAPLWAGFMALVNQQAQASGLPSVGFANPALYSLARTSYGTTFYDITTGSSTNGNPANNGFTYSATTGYDMTTGLGSPQCGLIGALAGGFGPPCVNSCALSNLNCGVVSRGCHGPLDCGTCPVPEACGASGTPNVCGLTAANACQGTYVCNVDSFPPTLDIECPSPFNFFSRLNGNLTFLGTSQQFSTATTLTDYGLSILACRVDGSSNCDGFAEFASGPCTPPPPTPCRPNATCDNRCDTISDGCGNLVKCDPCPAGLVCRATQCIDPGCIPRKCPKGTVWGNCACERG